MARDLSGKTALVTGASSGIGYETALGLARRGMRVFTASRGGGVGAAKAEAVRRASGNSEVHFLPADLSSLHEVRRLAETAESEAGGLDVLVNNAGVYSGRRRLTEDGFELTFALNHLAPFLLTTSLLESMSSGARVVTVSSEAARGARLHEDVMLARGYSGWKAYAQSKLANLLFTLELARRLSQTGITANALHPGAVATGFARQDGGFTGTLFKVLGPLLRSAEKGAETVLYLAASDEAALVSGLYFKDEKPLEPPRAALERAAQARLWQLSETLVEPFVNAPRSEDAA